MLALLATQRAGYKGDASFLINPPFRAQGASGFVVVVCSEPAVQEMPVLAPGVSHQQIIRSLMFCEPVYLLPGRTSG
ncbi:MAG: hypothetical protein JSU70_03975 [Phycisphaerales bacterium]|nr:MAG: hypothetical protein JSU70_03975 [Phycisphaerales bacterium]